MKKIFIRVLTVALVAIMFAMPMTANAKELAIKPEPKTVANVQAQEDELLFIGQIKSYKDGMVEVDKLFDLENNFSDDATIYIDVTGAEFPDGKINEYPEGYLITVNYSQIVKEDTSINIVADKVNAVEEDGEVTICEEVSTTDEVEEEELVVETPEKCGVVEMTLWDRILDFFSNIFS